ncbi:hypothetical protein GCM10010275_19090 [Streptomyces litmocidini]|uniref:hypothetical protein n=1 Tax=Streptomyces litmocidini TaxID=67318 RepID=UPI00167CBBF8|nr:hypothetical protein [Streptomyces litmocidini]GGU83961.1 hypothetical protein GCM10010275_19090 [Streptomyces litmocidini]
MGKKQTRTNRGARTGGHEHRTEAVAKEKSAPNPTRAAQMRLVEHASHRKERRFGHN